MKTGKVTTTVKIAFDESDDFKEGTTISTIKVFESIDDLHIKTETSTKKALKQVKIKFPSDMKQTKLGG